MLLPPMLSLSLWPLHLGASSSSPVPRCSPSLLQPGLISLPLSPRMNPHPAPPPPTLTLCPPFTSLCQAWICPPPLPLFILPHPTRPVQTAALLQFMGLLLQLPAAERKSKRKTGQRTWEEMCGGNMWLKKRVVEKDRGWIRVLNKWLKESGAQDPSSSIEATTIPVCC